MQVVCDIAVFERDRHQQPFDHLVAVVVLCKLTFYILAQLPTKFKKRHVFFNEKSIANHDSNNCASGECFSSLPDKII